MLLMFLNQTETSLKQQEVQSSALSVIIGIDTHLSRFNIPNVSWLVDRFKTGNPKQF